MKEPIEESVKSLNGIDALDDFTKSAKKALVDNGVTNAKSFFFTVQFFGDAHPDQIFSHCRGRCSQEHISKAIAMMLDHIDNPADQISIMSDAVDYMRKRFIEKNLERINGSIIKILNKKGKDND